VNPAHLEPVTHRVNVLRGTALVTSCPSGHPYDDNNTSVSPRGHRMCRACHRFDEARRNAQRRAA
jgi:hypothetical protein